ncbi:MAG: hypothetical protein AAF661_15145 [Pseudomonadota bacterium]
MHATIYVEWLFGRPATGAEEDEARAEAAAAAVLDATGKPYQTIHAEFSRQWEEAQDYEGLTGLAQTWVSAEKAADLALTEGWHNPNGASCSLRLSAPND